MPPVAGCLHRDFPHAIWVVVEQPPGEEKRLKYDPTAQRFVPTGQRSLIFVRGFTGAYGWIAGLGDPPARHADALVVTPQRLAPGDAVEARVVGMFRRADGDHKIVSVDVGVPLQPHSCDLFALDAAVRSEVLAVYPQAGQGEGWYGGDDTRAYLKRLAHEWRQNAPRA